jgi:hypothetical protein
MPEKPLLSFDQLTSVAADLNQASDELTRVVNSLDSALQRLNVGIVAWVLISKNNDERFSHLYECEQVGYAKVNGNWCLAIRRLAGNESSPEAEEVRDIWPFNDAPRGMRLRAIEKLPEVIDALARSALRTTERLKKKLAETRGFAASIGVWQGDEAKGRKQ